MDMLVLLARYPTKVKLLLPETTSGVAYLVVDNHVRGGVDSFVRTLLRGLARCGTPTCLIINRSFPGLEDIRRMAIPLLEIRTFRSSFSLSWFTGLGRSRGRVRQKVHNGLVWLIELLAVPASSVVRRIQYRWLENQRVLVINGGFPGSPSCRAMTLALSHKNVIYMNVHGLAPPHRGLKRHIEERIDTALSRRVTRFVSVSNAARDALQSRLPSCGVDHSVVLNAVEAPEAIPHSTTSPKATEIKGRGFEVGLVGTFHRDKGHFFALEIMAKIRENLEICAWRLNLFGADPYNISSAVKQRARDLKVEDLVEFHEYEEDPNIIYRNIDVLIIPSLKPESFSLVAAEAAARTIPVFASNVGALPEIMTLIHRSQVLDSKNPSSWAEALLKWSTLDKSPEPRELVTSPSRLFSPDSMTKEYLDILFERST